MPSTEKAVLDLTVQDQKAISATPPTVGLETDDWPSATKKSKKVKKGKKNVTSAKPKSENGDESPALADGAATPALSELNTMHEKSRPPETAEPDKLLLDIDDPVTHDEQAPFPTQRELEVESFPSDKQTSNLRRPNSTFVGEDDDANDLLFAQGHFMESTSRNPEPSLGPTQAEYQFVRSPKPATAPLAQMDMMPALLAVNVDTCAEVSRNAVRTFHEPANAVSSLRSQISPDPYSLISAQARPADIPLPHKPQPHFFSVPDLGFGFSSKQEHGKTAGSDGCHCGFDSFAESGHLVAGRRAKDVLLVGSEGGLDVYRVLSDKLEVVGRLEGLRGAVVAARILPQPYIRGVSTTAQPFVATLIRSATQSKSGSTDPANPVTEPYSMSQMTLEVYSLSEKRHIATLFKSAPTRLHSAGLTADTPTRPENEFYLDARGEFISLASGKSGEIWMYSNLSRSGEDPRFRCLGKFWTTLQTTQDSQRSNHVSDHRVTEIENASRQPLFSLSNRWLAIVPPYTSAGSSVQGVPILNAQELPPAGLYTQLAPIQPLVTCEVADTDEEGTLSWLSRKAAQGLVKASQRGYKIGLQGWKELTNPAPPNASQNANGQRPDEMFPPTNAPADDPKRLAKEPALLSILDLRTLASMREQGLPQIPGPLATFALVDGCNYLCFSPDGTRLLTTNRKGEASSTWDLTHIAHGKSKHIPDQDRAFEKGPHVRQIQHMVRSSPSTVVEGIWSQNGDKVALLTTHGTVHLHEALVTLSSKKRRRQSMPNKVLNDKAEPTIGVSQGMSPPSSNGFWNSVRFGVQSVSAQVNAMRTQSPGLPTSFAGFREVAGAAGQAGGRAVAKSFSQGFSAAKGGASDIWNAENNKIRQKALHNIVGGQPVLRWIQRKGETFLAVVSGGTVYLYPVQREVRRKGSVDMTGLRKFAPRTFLLPRITVKGSDNGCSSEGPHGFWTLHRTDDGRAKAPIRDRRPDVDVETNPPYCPLHVDRRVNIFAFDDGPNASQIYRGSEAPWQMRGHGLDNARPWAFGDDLKGSTRVNVQSSDHEEDADREFDMQELDGVSDQVESKLTIRPAHSGESATDEQIRVNTRRARKRRDSSSSLGFMPAETNYPDHVLA